MSFKKQHRRNIAPAEPTQHAGGEIRDSLSPELRLFEAQLANLLPRSDRLNSSEFFYAAGQQSVASHRPSGFWRVATGSAAVSSVASVVLTLLIVSSLAQPDPAESLPQLPGSRSPTHMAEHAPQPESLAPPVSRENVLAENGPPANPPPWASLFQPVSSSGRSAQFEELQRMLQEPPRPQSKTTDEAPFQPARLRPYFEQRRSL